MKIKKKGEVVINGMKQTFTIISGCANVPDPVKIAVQIKGKDYELFLNQDEVDQIATIKAALSGETPEGEP